MPKISTYLLRGGEPLFYEGQYETRLQQLRELDNLDLRVHFLQNNSYLLPNSVRILGTTLWSHVPQQTASKIGQCLNDCRFISTVIEKDIEGSKIETLRRITVDDTNEWHAHQHTWLLQEIQKARQNREHVVVITHHAPSRRATCSEDGEEAGIQDAFINDHDADCVDPVRLWVYGHTHRSTDFIVNSTRVVSNQVGYTWENTGFRSNMRITLYDDGAVTVIDPVSIDS